MTGSRSSLSQPRPSRSSRAWETAVSRAPANVPRVWTRLIGSAGEHGRQRSAPRAGDVRCRAARENAETVVIGKREQIRTAPRLLSPAAGTNRRGRSRTAKRSWRVRSPARSRAPSRTGCSAPPRSSPTDVTGSVDPGPVGAAARVLRPGPVSRRPARGRDQSRDAEDRVRAAARRWRRPGDRGRHDAPLPSPFFLVATENPIEQEGTFPSPEAQLDRFSANLLRLSRRGRGAADRRGSAAGHPLESLRPVVSIAGRARAAGRRSTTCTSTRSFSDGSWR